MEKALVIFVASVTSTCLAFVSPTTTALTARDALKVRDLSAVLLADDVGIEDAFTDTIDFMDETVGTLLLGAAVVVALLVAFKFLTGQMDSAITQVLLDFESTMKQYYPSRWENIKQELDGLKGDERDIKLLRVMEDLQETDPDFMVEVRKQMPRQ